MHIPHVINIPFFFQGFRAWHQARLNPTPLDMPKDHRQDQKYRCSNVYLDFLCMDGDHVKCTMCPITQCTTCWCAKEHWSDQQDVVYPSREITDIRERVAKERKKSSCTGKVGMDGRAIAAESLSYNGYEWIL